MTDTAATNGTNMTAQAELNKDINNKHAEWAGERPWGLNPNKKLQPAKECREWEQ